MTRKEFLKKEVEEVVNNKILPIISKREKDEKLIEKLTDEEFEQINQQIITEEK